MYDVTGRPSPFDVENIFTSMNNDRLNDALKTIVEIKQTKSLSVEDILTEIHKRIM